VDAETARDWALQPTLQDLAARLGVSVSSLTHRFKEETGQSVMQRVRLLRMQRAADQLREPQATVSSVAQAFGFRHACHFSRSFRQIMGESPSAFLNPTQVDQAS
jgi:two-component system response regulator YesN